MTVNNDVLLALPTGSLQASFVRRVKRFSVELKLDDEPIWAHCNNTGSMLGLLRRGTPVIISPARGKNRKLQWTLERVWHDGVKAQWIGVNTQLPNHLLRAAFAAGLLDFAAGYKNIKMESARGQSRLDALIWDDDKPRLWVECKNVSMVEDCVAAFPDSFSERGQKHLKELMSIVKSGERAAMFYCVQRQDAKCFGPADFIDAEYAKLFYAAIQCGVEMYPYELEFCSKGYRLGRLLKIVSQQC